MFKNLKTIKIEKKVVKEATVVCQRSQCRTTHKRKDCQLKIKGPQRAFFWCIMEKEFDVQTKLNLPKEVYLKKIEEYTIVISPNKPNWVVFDDLEYKLFDLLSINPK